MIEFILIISLVVVAFFIFRYIKDKNKKEEKSDNFKEEKSDNLNDKKPPDDIYPLY